MSFHDESLEAVRKALQESEERYRVLFNSIDEGFCIIEVLFDERGHAVDYRFLHMNPAFVAQTGLIEAEGRTVRELDPRHEEHWFEIYGRVAQTGEPARFENEARHLNPPRFYDVYAFRYGAAEKRQVAVLFNDIGPRKRAEEALRETERRYRQLIREAPAGIYEIDFRERTC